MGIELQASYGFKGNLDSGEAARRGMEERKICFITGMSKKVVREYLEFIEGNELISKGSNERGGEGIIWTYYPQ